VSHDSSDAKRVVSRPFRASRAKTETVVAPGYIGDVMDPGLYGRLLIFLFGYCTSFESSTAPPRAIFLSSL